ncbi:S100 calcium binding protein S isoform X1 [Syngnathus scovelli]|uniref:S100 calcium binding protein S isoform X1 n=3 Tax=Syngnathus TaxID=103719 RepID=UPI00211070C1|nr:S100 calcium binding protein S isoform X1 [Syngnathus scovelli]
MTSGELKEEEGRDGTGRVKDVWGNSEVLRQSPQRRGRSRSTKMPDTIMSKEPSSNLESAMQMLIKTFHKYSGKEGDKYTLSRGELKELLLEELGSYLGNSKDNEAVEKVMNDLDANNDGEVDFTEFIILMGALTVACNDFFLEFKSDDKPKGCESAE